MKYYAVKQKSGKESIYTTWTECEKHVKNKKGVRFKSFATRKEAENFLRELSGKKVIPISYSSSGYFNTLASVKTSSPVKKKKVKKEVEALKDFTLTKKQQKAIDLILKGKNVFLTGEAGTGKSYVIRKAIEGLEKNKRKVLVCAPTGIAAVNVRGVTIHRLLQLQDVPFSAKTNRMYIQTPEEFSVADVIILDEVSMCRMDLFDCLIKSIQKSEEIHNREIQIVIVGDFCQLPPVLNSASGEREMLENYYKRPIGNGFAFQSDTWEYCDFTTIIFDEILRQEDKEFVTQLNLARKGDISCIEYFNTHSSKEPIEGGIYLSGTNREVNEINKKQLDLIPGKIKRIKADKEGENISVLADDVLELKVGARVMFLVNGNDYSNGTFGTVTRIKDTIQVKVDGTGRLVEVGEYTWEGYKYNVVNGELRKKKIGSVTQIPLKLAYAVTIHKSQGQTFTKVNLNPKCWDSGQLYCALSRVTDINNLHLTKPIVTSELIADKNVKEFYDNLKEGCKEAPVKDFVTMEIPAELQKQVEKLINGV